jgi:hypothetical protein
MARSNRQLTQFAVSKIRAFLHGGAERFFPETQGNTGVIVDSGNIVKVTLFGQPILCLRQDAIVVHAGGFYDTLGRPSRTTRERLNGLLDALGDERIIPEGIRAFIDKETQSCFVGRGGIGRELGSACEKAIIAADPFELSFL